MLAGLRNAYQLIGGWVLLTALVGCATPPKETMPLIVQQDYNEKLLQVFDNLEYLWAVDKQHSEEYAAAHNAFLKAHKRLPDVPLPGASALEYFDQFVEFNVKQAELKPAGPLRMNARNTYEDAIPYLKQSEAISKQLLARHLDEVEQEARQAREDIRKLVRADPDNAIQEFLTDLDEVLLYAERVRDNPQVVELDRIAKATDVTAVATVNIDLQALLNQTVETDFRLGRYELADLSAQDQALVRAFIERLVQLKQQYERAGHPINLKVKVVGYTDQTGFKPGTPLVRKLLQGLAADAIPSTQPQRRHFLNRRLSLFRAQAIGAYIQQLLAELDPQNVDAHLRPEIEGKGEQIPEGVRPPYPAADPRRRICKLSVTVRSQEKGPQPFRPAPILLRDYKK
jgi:outer membrane protein OmpA-like peptidoglycan-associated protein